MNLVELLHTYLIATRDEVVSSHHFHILLAFKLGQVVDDILTAKCLPHRQIVHKQALCNHIEDSFSYVKHLLLTYLYLHGLLTFLIIVFLLLIVVVLLVLVVVFLVLLLLLLILLLLLFLQLLRLWFLILIRFLFARFFLACLLISGFSR